MSEASATGLLRERLPAISTPVWDGLLTGGLCLVGMGGLLLFRASGGEVVFRERDWVALAILLNSPHFMASYRVLYASREGVLRHRWATIGVPLVLLGVITAAALARDATPILRVLVLVSSVYLAWHYAGQTWGMVATFSRLAGVSYTERERRCLRAGPRSLLVLHVLFALSGRLPPVDWIDPRRYVAAYTWAVYATVAAAALSLLAGSWAFVSARRRGEAVPIRAVLPWASYFLWYPFWIFVPSGFFWLQLAHALQYMAFPMRLDLNRYVATGARSPGARRRHVVATYLALVAVGAIVLHGPPLATHALGEGWYSSATMRQMLAVLTHCVGIHHYFVDGAIWKLRDESVRRALFAHLPAREATA
jgi:hypothetical protein